MFKKLQFKIEFLVSYLKQKYPYLLIGISFGIVAFVYRQELINIYNLPILRTKVIGVEGLYTENTLPEEITNLISYGLTQNSDNDRPINSPIAKLHDIENQNKDYIFDIEPNIYWHNKKKFTAYDINYQISGIKIIPESDTRVRIKTDNAFSPLLSVLSSPLFKKGLIGLGPYYVTNITYKEGYVKTVKLKPQSNQFNKITYNFYSNEKDLINAYKLGLVDEIQSSILPEEFSSWDKTKITQVIETNNRYSAVFFNTEKINNKQLRQAMAYATPKTQDKNERCLGPISPTSWAYNPSVKTYAFDPTHAKELFEKNKIETINLSVYNRKLLPLATEIKNSWKEVLGIETTITIEDQIGADYDAILTFAAIPHDPDQYSFWHSTQIKTNLTKLNNSRIDKLLEEGRQSIDSQERKRIYQDFQRYLLEESPAIFLSYPTSYQITRVK